MNKIKKGDNVRILLGKDRGKAGKVERVLNKEKKLLVGGVNMVKRHIGKKVTGQEGTVLELPKPVDMSNVALICPNCKKPTRVGFKITGENKSRICRKCGKEIDVKVKR
ncbi:MAG: large subunit ribosomal protein L24 [Microgenomates group bacterium Gr01-1014_80]|nr:MAG: large subunit ribosomal protein L24 [Microgenomates group bacterium Gr01-1014_80]